MNNNILGQKWTHNYYLHLTALGDNLTLQLQNGDGNIIYFRKSDTTYYPDAISGDHSWIVKNANGSYTRTAKDGTVHEFDNNGLLSSIRDRNGKTTSLTYSSGNLSSITDQNGRITSITTTSGRITAITDPMGRTYTLTYTGSFLTAITDPLGNARQFTYDNSGKMLSKRDPLNRQTTYTYDSTGKLLTATDPEGKTRTINYNQSGSTGLTEKDGGIRTYTYDPVFTVITAKTDPLGYTTSYTYDLKRNLIKTVAPDGSVITNTYDANNNLTTVTDQLGNIAHYTYNSLNLVSGCGGLGCLDRKQGFISEKLYSVNVHAAACFCG